MGLGLLRVVLLQVTLVIVHVDSPDSCVVLFRILFTLLVALDPLESRELLDRVGDMHASVHTALHRAEHLVAGGDAGESDVEEGLERLAQVFLALGLEGVVLIHDVLGLAVEGGVALVERVQVLFGEQALAQEEARELSGGVVLEPRSESVVPELEGVRALEDVVAREGGVDDLRDHPLVGHAHD